MTSNNTVENIKKILLVTLTPPGDRNVGEIILRDLCAYLPKNKLVVFTIAPNPPVEKLAWDNEFAYAPDEKTWRPFSGKVGSLFSHLYYRFVFKRRVSRMVDKVVNFGKIHGVEVVWITLNSVTLISFGAEVARRLNVPQLGLVWDPPDYLARRCGLDRLSRKLLQEYFSEAMRISDRVAVVSEGMVEEYSQRYGCNCVILRHAMHNTTVKPDSLVPDNRKNNPLRIGFAGTLYDMGQFNMLLEALNLCGWKIGDRPIFIRMIGNWFRFNGMSFPCNIELMGWRSTDETSHLLSECDLNFLPVPFSEEWQDLAVLCFPTKLSTYLSSGRPVFVYGPDYASSIKFCKQTGIGITCSSQNPEQILKVVSSFLCDQELYHQAQSNVFQTRDDYFSLCVMKRQFAGFLGVDESVLNKSC